MISANRVEYQHNRKVVTDDKGRVIELKTPIDISFGSDDHSEYFAAERSLDQLTGLRTIRWEMDDDWWAAAYYHAYSGKKPKGKANTWWERIVADKCGRMSASDGHSLTTDTKKKAPHFDKAWNGVLNAAITPGTGVVEDTESERRAVIAEREGAAEKKRGDERTSALKSVGGSFMVLAWDPADPGEKVEMTAEEAQLFGWVWE
jgi:hypothetical protein